MKLISTVAERAAEKGMPASESTAGLTTMMYMPARKVAMPASNSVFSVEPRRLTPNQRSRRDRPSPEAEGARPSARVVELGCIPEPIVVVYGNSTLTLPDLSVKLPGARLDPAADARKPAARLDFQRRPSPREGQRPGGGRYTRVTA